MPQFVAFSAHHLLPVRLRDSKKGYLPVDENASLLRLLQEVHEFALAFRQVKLKVLVAFAEGQPFVLGQALVGVHDIKTHLLLWLFGLRLCAGLLLFVII